MNITRKGGNSIKRFVKRQVNTTDISARNSQIRADNKLNKTKKIQTSGDNMKKMLQMIYPMSHYKDTFKTPNKISKEIDSALSQSHLAAEDARVNAEIARLAAETARVDAIKKKKDLLKSLIRQKYYAYKNSVKPIKDEFKIFNSEKKEIQSLTGIQSLTASQSIALLDKAFDLFEKQSKEPLKGEVEGQPKPFEEILKDIIERISEIDEEKVSSPNINISTKDILTQINNDDDKNERNEIKKMDAIINGASDKVNEELIRKLSAFVKNHTLITKDEFINNKRKVYKFLLNTLEAVLCTFQANKFIDSILPGDDEEKKKAFIYKAIIQKYICQFFHAILVENNKDINKLFISSTGIDLTGKLVEKYKLLKKYTTNTIKENIDKLDKDILSRNSLYVPTDISLLITSDTSEIEKKKILKKKSIYLPNTENIDKTYLQIWFPSINKDRSRLYNNFSLSLLWKEVLDKIYQFEEERNRSQLPEVKAAEIKEQSDVIKQKAQKKHAKIEKFAEKNAAAIKSLKEEKEAAQKEEARKVARKTAEEESARKASEEEAARLAAEEESARLAAEKEAARLAAEEESARLAAEKEAARLAAEKEAARLAAQALAKKAEDIQKAEQAKLAAGLNLTKAKKELRLDNRKNSKKTQKKKKTLADAKTAAKQASDRLESIRKEKEEQEARVLAHAEKTKKEITSNASRLAEEARLVAEAKIIADQIAKEKREETARREKEAATEKVVAEVVAARPTSIPSASSKPRKPNAEAEEEAEEEEAKAAKKQITDAQMAEFKKKAKEQKEKKANARAKEEEQENIYNKTKIYQAQAEENKESMAELELLKVNEASKVKPPKPEPKIAQKAAEAKALANAEGNALATAKGNALATTKGNALATTKGNALARAEAKPAVKLPTPKPRVSEAKRKATEAKVLANAETKAAEEAAIKLRAKTIANEAVAKYKDRRQQEETRTFNNRMSARARAKNNSTILSKSGNKSGNNQNLQESTNNSRVKGRLTALTAQLESRKNPEKTLSKTMNPLRPLNNTVRESIPPANNRVAPSKRWYSPDPKKPKEKPGFWRDVGRGIRQGFRTRNKNVTDVRNPSVNGTTTNGTTTIGGSRKKIKKRRSTHIKR